MQFFAERPPQSEVLKEEQRHMKRCVHLLTLVPLSDTIQSRFFSVSFVSRELAAPGVPSNSVYFPDSASGLQFPFS
jgi:hypothetical protein